MSGRGERSETRSLLGRLLRVVRARRLRVFILAVVVTLAFLILPSWNAISVYRAAEAVSAQEVRLQRLFGMTFYLDEVLSMSARMAAATGDPAWERRYRSFEPQLEAALRETIQLEAGAYAASAARTEAASRKLGELHDEAFALVRQGRLDEATQLLLSEVYAANRRSYIDGLDFLATSIDERVQRDIAQHLRRVVGAGALTLLSSGMLVLAWVGVVALIWRHLAARGRAEEERKYLEAQIQYMQKLESLGVMAGGVAHDFNNLLMPILGNVDLALDELPPESSTRKRLEKLREAGRRLADLTHQLLAYSGKGAVEARAVNLSELVADLTRLLEISVSKKATLHYELAEDLPSIEGDPSQLGQVVMNLVGNASEALGDEGGTISVRTGFVWADRADFAGSYTMDDFPEGSYVQLEVADTGQGMDAETRRQVFDPFFTTKFTGRGLGLAVVLGIVRGHHGAISVDSWPGRGTTFRILFPQSEQRATSPGTERTTGEGWRGTGTALVVDDEPGVRELAEEMLGRLGFRVLAAQDGREGLETFAKHAGEIDVVLLDLTMPGMSGEEALEAIQRIEPGQRVVLMSGYNEEFVASQFAGRIAGFLQKPFAWEELGETLKAIVRERS